MYYVQNAESGQTETWKVGARYRLLSVLGCGSYGAVCKAADVHARRLVALKRVPDALNTLESAKRVLREVVVLNRLDHPNIIKVFDMFYTPATSGARRMNPETFSLVPVSIDLYMAFEIADGGDLFELRGEMSAAEVRSLMRQLAGAVKYLHDVGVWHRDIKSANTLCGRNRAGGRVAKICDFGLARGAASANDTDRETRGDDKSDADERMATGEEDEFRARRPKKHRRSFSGSSRGSFGSGGVLASGSRSVVGFARVTSFARADMLTSVVATPCYRAPEVIMSDGGYTGAIDVWALGCIFGELLQRQQQHALTPHLTVSPLFRFDDDPVSEPDSGETYTKWMSNGVANGDRDGDGDGDVDMRDATSRRERRVKARLNLFFDVVGTPSWRDVRAVSSERWRAYLRGIRGRPGSLTRQFAGCDDASRDLLLRMLTFDSGRRATPDEILAHEYFLADEGAHRSAEQGADQSLDATVGSDLASMDADARLWEMDQPGAALAALETEFAAAAAARETAFAPAAATAARGARVSRNSSDASATAAHEAARKMNRHHHPRLRRRSRDGNRRSITRREKTSARGRPSSNNGTSPDDCTTSSRSSSAARSDRWRMTGATRARSRRTRGKTAWTSSRGTSAALRARLGCTARAGLA